MSQVNCHIFVDHRVGKCSIRQPTDCYQSVYFVHYLFIL